MKTTILILIGLLMPYPLEARPSMRSIRNSAERYEEQQAASRYKQNYKNEAAGLTLQYPVSWLKPKVTNKTALDGRLKYSLVQFIPHDRDYEVGSRRNRILELYTEVWPLVGALSLAELDDWARLQSAHRYREYFASQAYQTEVAGYPAWHYSLNTMTGEREEVWVAVQDRVFVFGYRSLRDFFAKDHFFFEELLASVQFSLPPVPDADVTTEQPVASLEPLTTSALFTDVPSSHPYAPAILWGQANQVVQGYDDGSFRPEQLVNRVELLKIIFAAKPELLTAADLPATGFTDVDAKAWYAPYLRLAKNRGIVKGYSDGSFRPGQVVNIAEALKMAYEAFAVATAEATGPWYQRYLNDALKRDILFDSNMPMNAGMKRKDVVWLVWKLAN